MDTTEGLLDKKLVTVELPSLYPDSVIIIIDNITRIIYVVLSLHI